MHDINRQSKIIVWLVCLALIVGGAASSVAVSTKADPAAGEEINWEVISSGGTDGNSASYYLQGTVGQTAVGKGSSDSYYLSQGFWQVFPEGCCGIYTEGISGNANCSEDGKLTLSDISRMIDFLYISKADLCCYAAGNTNGSWDDGECKITLSDISKLIDVLYISKQPPADCMPECER